MIVLFDRQPLKIFFPLFALLQITDDSRKEGADTMYGLQDEGEYHDPAVFSEG